MHVLFGFAESLGYSEEEFLLNENNIDKIWKEITLFEREYIEGFLIYDELPTYEKVKYLHEKYGVEKETYKN